MIIHKQLECPFCHIVQKAEIYSSGDDIKTATVDNITFGTCRHYVFGKDLIRDILRSEDKPHPKENSKNEFKCPPLGRLLRSERYHSGGGVIVDKDIWEWYHTCKKGTDYILTEEETDLVLRLSFKREGKFSSNII